MLPKEYSVLNNVTMTLNISALKASDLDQEN